MSGIGGSDVSTAQQTPLGSQPTTGQLSVDQQRNQMLAQISAFLGTLAGGGGATNGSIFAYTSSPLTANTVLTVAYAGIACDTSGGAFTLTLPLAASIPGKMYFFKKIDATGNQVTIAATGSDTVDGAASAYLIAKNLPLIIQSFGGTKWYIMSTA